MSEQLDASARSPSPRGAPPGGHRPRREQRRHAARARPPTSTWCAAASRSTASTRSGRTRATHGLEPAMELRSYVADVKRFEAGASAGYGRTWRRGGDLGRACCRSATATACGAGSPTTRASWWAAADTRSSAPSRWTTSPMTSGPRRIVEPGDEVVLIGEQGRRAHPRRGARAALETINYEVTCGISPRVAAGVRGRLVSRAGATRFAGRPRWPSALEVPEGGWVVGGAVRDALLGRDVIDVDLAVEPGDDGGRCAGDRARRPEGSRSRSPRSSGPGASVPPRPRLARRRHARSAADDDRGRSGLRDFTSTRSPFRWPTPTASRSIPPAARRTPRLGCCVPSSDRAFDDDPLRLLRAARIAARARIRGRARDRRARARGGGRGRASRRASASFAELRRSSPAPRPLRGLELLDELGATAAVLPELDSLRGVVQNPNHHLDVHGHTIEVLEERLGHRGRPRGFAGDLAPRGEPRSSPSRWPTTDPRPGLRFGALLHDIGKPATRGEHGGYVTFIGHDRVGAEIVADLQARCGPAAASHPPPGPGAPPPAPRLPGPRAPAAAPHDLRLPAGHRAGGSRRHPPQRRRPPGRPRQRSARRARDDRGPHGPGARDAGRGSGVAPRRARHAAVDGDELAREAGDRAGPGDGPPPRELEAARVRGRDRRPRRGVPRRLARRLRADGDATASSAGSSPATCPARSSTPTRRRSRSWTSTRRRRARAGHPARALGRPDRDLRRGPRGDGRSRPSGSPRGWRRRSTPTASTCSTACGAAAWQTVFHFHLHVIPRYEDDPLKLPWVPAAGRPRRDRRSRRRDPRATADGRAPIRSSATATSPSIVLDEPAAQPVRDDAFDALVDCVAEIEGSDARALVWRAEGDIFTGGADVNASSSRRREGEAPSASPAR